MLDAAELETLIAHEARYFEIWSNVTRQAGEAESGASGAWFLDSETLPHYHSANRALRLRVGSQNAEHHAQRLAAEVIAHYRGRGLPVVADVDAIAETQGIGRELRQRGVLPVAGSTLLMRYGTSAPPTLPPQYEQETGIAIERIPNETGKGEARDWVYLAGVDEKNRKRTPIFWRKGGRIWKRARSDCRLYLAILNGQAAGACQLFSASWLGADRQRDDASRHFRRRGIASRLVSAGCEAIRSRWATQQRTFLRNEAARARKCMSGSVSRFGAWMCCAVIFYGKSFRPGWPDLP